MDDLIQANLELHAELGKEVRINLENEAKISRLEKQQVRYEEDIQYLYGIIEKLEVRSDYSKKEKDSLTLRISELQSQLRNSEETCNEKEKFILFRESQLSELEKTIYQLKQPASTSHNKMSRTRTDLAFLDTMTNAQRLEEIQANIERLYLYTVRSERLPDVGTAKRLRERTNRAIPYSMAYSTPGINQETRLRLSSTRGVLCKECGTIKGGIVKGGINHVMIDIQNNDNLKAVISFGSGFFLRLYQIYLM